MKAAEGYHQSAIIDLEKILPTFRFTPPHVYLDCLNSYAVELSHVGRLQEAQDVASLVIASPLSSAYPEWRDTVSEIRSKGKRRSTVTISRAAIETESEAESLKPVSNVPQFLIEESVPEPRTQTLINFYERKSSPQDFCKRIGKGS